MVKLLLNEGDRITHKQYGSGTVTKIDPSDIDMRYRVLFDDGSKAWLANWQIVKEVV